MNFKKIKKQFLQRKFNKILALEPDSKTPTTKKIISVGILTTDEISSRFNLPQKVKTSLEGVRNVHIFSLRDFIKGEEKSFKHFTEKDINWKGKVLDTSLEVFLDTPFDLLIGYFDEKLLFLEYAVLKSNAEFKIGFSTINNQLFDMVIAEKYENIDSFLKEVYKYLHLLKKM